MQGRGGAGDEEVGRAGLLHEVVGVFERGVRCALGGGDGSQGVAGGEWWKDDGGEFLRGFAGHFETEFVHLRDVGDGVPALLIEALFVLLQLAFGVDFGGEVNERGGDEGDEEDEEGGRAEGRFFHAVRWWCGVCGGWGVKGATWGVNARCVGGGCGRL